MDTKELLKEIVEIDSIFPNEKDLAEFVESYLLNLGFIVNRQYVSENRFNILAEKGDGDRSLLFYGHLDTVPVYGEWKTNPLELSEDGDVLRGLGVVDMKGGIVAILKAVENKNISGFKLKVAFGVDEENISEGGYVLVNSRWCDDVVAVIVPETGTTTEKSIGPRAIVLGRRGRAAYVFRVPGVSVHGAGYGGINAIEEAAKIVLNLNKLKMAKHEKLSVASMFVRTIRSDSGSLSIPEYAEIIIDRHLIPPENKYSVLNEFKNFIDDLYNNTTLTKIYGRKVEVDLQKRKTPYLDPYIISENDEFTIFVSNIIKNKYGNVDYGYGLSVADENLFCSILKIPVLVIGPLGGNNHSANEWVSYQSLIELTDIFIKIIDDFSQYLSGGN